MNKADDDAVVKALHDGCQTIGQIIAASGLSSTPVRRILAELETAQRVRFVRRHVRKTKARHYSLIA